MSIEVELQGVDLKSRIDWLHCNVSLQISLAPE